MTTIFIWSVVLICSIRGIYSNIVNRNFPYTVAFIVTALFATYMLADILGYLPPLFVEKLFNKA